MQSAALLALAVLLAAAPKACRTRATPLIADQDPSPPPVPPTRKTTPPIWHPPEPSPATSDAPSAQVLPSAELTKARASFDTKDFKRVKALLEKKVRSGKGGIDEAQLLYRACVQLKDKACSDSVKAKHPELTE